MDPFHKHLINQMKSHCDNGVRVADGDSARNALNRKLGLMSTANKFDGPKELVSQRRKFSTHITEFIEYHHLEGEVSCNMPDARLVS